MQQRLHLHCISIPLSPFSDIDVATNNPNKLLMELSYCTSYVVALLVELEGEHMPMHTGLRVRTYMQTILFRVDHVKFSFRKIAEFLAIRMNSLTLTPSRRERKGEEISIRRSLAGNERKRRISMAAGLSASTLLRRHVLRCSRVPSRCTACL